MAVAKSKPYWIDILDRKHECWSYDEPQTVRVAHGDREFDLLMPEGLPEFETVTVAESGEALFLIGRLLGEDFCFEDEARLGVSIVARREGPGRYSVVAWHETYPWLLEKLGLGGNADGAGGDEAGE